MPWKDDLPEKVRDWDEVKNAETPEAFFDQISNMRSAMGQSLRIPGDDASEETHKAFHTKLTEKVPGLVQVPGDDDTEGQTALYRRLGAPETFEGYETGDDVVALSLREAAFASGLSKKQFSKVIERLVTGRAAAKEEADTLHTTGRQTLKEEWGQAFEGKMNTAELIRNQYFAFSPEMDKLSADTVKAFVKLGEQMVGEAEGFKTVGEQIGVMTPSEAQLKISEIMNNKQHPYWIPRDPGNKAAREKMTKLNKYAYPG